MTTPLTVIKFQTLSSLALVFALHVFKVSSTIQQQRIRDELTNLGSQHRSTSWMKLMQLLTSEMCPLWPTTSKIGPKMLNSSLSPCGAFRFSQYRPTTLTTENRNDMFELSHRLIGIYKTSNATRSAFFIVPFPCLHDIERHAIGISIDNHALQTTIPRLQPPPPTTQATV